MRFALNHIAAPDRSLDAFFALARELGMTEVEIRNDTPDMVGSVPASAVRLAADKAGVTILSINAVYPFNVWSGDLPKKAELLADYASECGAKGLVMCPLNDGREVSDDDLVAALAAMLPILQMRGITGLVEPLGFPISSLRTKRKALNAIARAGGQETYKLVHDTFHHHLAGETEFFPAETGLVHISGVSDPFVGVADMLDPHRVLVDADDRLKNVEQIRAIRAAGYTGPFSFEPFAAEVQGLADLEVALRQSIEHIKAQL
ncbi:TIM barrel protein [uncultured Devosia sp.]|uniref:TIM barrel protein n=1 Tax=uncultured Devosia sp. TaxID=211434 RepID=UPI002636441B|nr:TIM barrel protein [uncultured Devosia sp.]